MNSKAMKRLALALSVFSVAFLPPTGASLAQAEDEKPESALWKRLKDRDANGDGKVSRDEFPGPDRMWNRMDTDGDGTITRKEADVASERMGGGRMGGGRRGQGQGKGQGRGRRGAGASGLSLDKIDTNKDGSISKAEWSAFFKGADKNKDDVLQKEEFDAAAGGRPMADAAPKVGAPAPKGSAKVRGLTAKIDLSSPKRTTVLIFGSWT
jgi:hypothetical protein